MKAFHIFYMIAAAISAVCICVFLSQGHFLAALACGATYINALVGQAKEGFHDE